MDDEDVVLEVVGEMLKTIGYDVEFAKDGSNHSRRNGRQGSYSKTY